MKNEDKTNNSEVMKMGHDLDDDELKATKKFYNLNKIEKNKVHIPLVYTPKHIDNFIDKIDVILYNSNTSDIGVSHSDYINIINELHKILNDYKYLYYKLYLKRIERWLS